jgi:hypothetical protein
MTPPPGSPPRNAAHNGRANQLKHLTSQDSVMNNHTHPERPLEPADQETGWWDESGRPAPWPEDFADPDAGWTTGTTDVLADDGDETDPENQPF